MGLAAGAIRGVRLTLMGSVLSSAVQLALLPVFARLIAPEDYGLIAAAMVILTPVVHVLGSGIERALIVAAELPGAAIDSMLAVMLALAAAATVAIVLAVWTGLPLGTEGWLLLLLAPLVVCIALSAVFRGVMRRRLAFGRLVAIDAVAQLVGSGTVAAIGIMAGWDARALAAGMLAQAAFQLACYAASCGHRVVGRFDRAAAWPILVAGFSITKTSILEVIYGQMPAAATGWGLGTAALGIYNRAYSLVQLPAEFFVVAVTRVAFPSLAQLRGDGRAMREAVAAVIEACAALLLPLCAGMAFAGGDLVATVLGPQWHEAAALIPWLCLGTGAAMLGHVFASINEAGLALEARFRIQAATLAFAGACLGLAVGVGLGLGLGLVAVAWATAAAAIFHCVLHVRLTARMLDLGPRDLLRHAVPGLSAGCACALVAGLADQLLPATLGSGWRLAIEVAGCGLATLATYGLGFPSLSGRLAGYAGFGQARRSAAS